MDQGRIVAEGEPARPRARARRPRGARAEARRGLRRRRARSPRSTAASTGHELAEDALMLYADDAEELLHPRPRALPDRLGAGPPRDARGRLPAPHRQEPGASRRWRSTEPRYARARRPALGRGDLVPSPRLAAAIWHAERPRVLEALEGRAAADRSSTRSSTCWRSGSGSAPTSRTVNGIPYKDFIAPGPDRLGGDVVVGVRDAPTTSTSG